MLTYNSYYVFEDTGTYYLFDIFNMECVNIDVNTYNALKAKDEELLAEDMKGVIQNLHNSGFFFYDVDDIEFSTESKGSVFFSLAPVTNCNLKCKYCFANSGLYYNNAKRNFNSQTAIDISNYLLRSFPDADRFRLDFVSGGEPLLKPQILYETLHSIKEVFEQNKKRLDVWLCTNGTLITKEILAWLDKNHVQIGISLDGDRDINDQCRVYADGHGSYQDTVEGVKRLLHNNDLSNNIKYLWGLCVITPRTNSLVDILKHHKSLGFKSVQMKFARLGKDNPLSFTEKNMQHAYDLIDELIDFVEESLKSNDIDSVILFANENDHIGKLINRLVLKKPYIYRCYAGRQKFSFSPNGDIYPCDSFVGNTSYRIGNIYENEINTKVIEKFNNLSVIIRKECNNCWARFVCGGDCFHNALCANGNIEQPDSIFCNIVKYSIKRILSMFNALYTYDENIVTNLKDILRIRSRII